MSLLLLVRVELRGQLQDQIEEEDQVEKTKELSIAIHVDQTRSREIEIGRRVKITLVRWTKTESKSTGVENVVYWLSCTVYGSVIIQRQTDGVRKRTWARY